MSEVDIFLRNLAQEWKIEELLELRIMGNTTAKHYLALERFARENEVYCNAKKSLFFTKLQFALIEKILPKLEGTKVCYSINPRVRDDNGEIKISGIDAISNLYALMFDIECRDKTKHFALLEGLKHYVAKVKQELSSKGLVSPTIVASGRGFHLIYSIPRTRNTPARRRWLHRFYDDLILLFENENFHIDKQVKDVSRTFGLPGSKNPKWDEKIEVLELGGLNKFRVGSAREKKQLGKASEVPEVEESLEWQILLAGAPQGDRHNSLIFPLKMILRDRGITNVREYERVVDEIYGGRCDLSPRGTLGKEYSAGIVVNWMKRNAKWCSENKICRLN